MQQGLLDLQVARHRAQRGMHSAQSHAEREVPGWASGAYRLLTRFLVERNSDFTIESFRWWAATNGLPDPPDARAFGGVTQRAIREGFIERVGYAPAASSNGSPKPLYRAVRLPEVA